MFKKPKFQVQWYVLIYLALAVSTYKHSAWSFSNVLEGPEPLLNWEIAGFTVEFAWQIMTVSFWWLWGGLMAMAVDVGLYFSARAIREHNIKRQYDHKRLFTQWTTYGIAAGLSAYTQLLYAAQHTTTLKVAETGVKPLQAGGWLFIMLEWAVIILPIALPGLSFLYTISLKVDSDSSIEQFSTKTDETTGETLYDAKAFAKLSGISASYIRKMALDGKIGRKDTDGKKWLFNEQDLITAKGLYGNGRTKVRSNNTSNEPDNLGVD